MTAQERALADYRAKHPEFDDVPDEAVADLTVVQLVAFGLALSDFASAMGQQVVRVLRRDES